MQVGRVLTVICKDVPLLLLLLFSAKTAKHEHESQSPASRQPSVMQKPLVSPHRCRVNHAVASQSVTLSPSLRILDKPVAMACVREACRSKGKEAWIGMQVYESGSVI